MNKRVHNKNGNDDTPNPFFSLEKASLLLTQSPSVNPFFVDSSDTTDGGEATTINLTKIRTTETRLPSKQSNSIQLQNIPKKFFATEFLNQFFSQFGVIIKVDLIVGVLNSAIVTFVNHESAKLAMENGDVLEEGEVPVSITWFSRSEIQRKSLPISHTVLSAKKVSNRNRQRLNEFKTSLKSLAHKLSSITCLDSKSKYDVLDTIDIAIRKGLERDRKHYRALKGSCMDMCPEKERYMRDDRHQASAFELINENTSLEGGELDHFKAVKEYSRSSADQEEPLAHELRPAPVLQFTMSYLLRNFMDLQYSHRPDWFDFLWNRTRAIRKDITQQCLSGLTCIELIEKCARFHIFCSHHLCEREMHIFDTKINLENLTKCLQTLKHMYEDNWKEQGYTCSNEAEFRCYQILLNLNNADTLREVMVFQQDVRDSSSVKFALNVFSSVHETNYVRFFKLLKKASFLNACLMHTYFHQMRAVALRTMACAFSVPKSDLAYPMENLQVILKFDDIEQVAEFSSHYGFSADDTHVYFSRTSFCQPDENFLPTKSSLISNKCEVLVAQVINGGPLPIQRDYVPTNSFSITGCYTGSYHDLSDLPDDSAEIDEAQDEADSQLEILSRDSSYQSNVFPHTKPSFVGDNQANPSAFLQEKRSIKTKERSVKEHSGVKSDPDFIINESDIEEDKEEEYVGELKEENVMYLREDVNSYTDMFLNEQLLEFIQELLTDLFVEINSQLSHAEALCDQVLALSCIQEARTSVVEVLNEEKINEEQEEVAIMKIAYQIYHRHYIDDQIQMILHSCCTEVLSEEASRVQHLMLVKESHLQQQQILNDLVSKEITRTAMEALDTLSLERKDNLTLLKYSFEKNKLKYLFKRWIKAYKYQAFVKTTLHHFPPLAPFLSTRDVIHHLQPSQRQGLKSECMDELRLGKRKEYKTLIKQYHQHKLQSSAGLRRPIPIDLIFKKSWVPKLKPNLNSSEFGWRLAMCSHCEWILKNRQISATMLMEKFSNQHKVQKELDKELIYHSSIRVGKESNINLSIMHILPDSNNEKGTGLLGISGLMFLIELEGDSSQTFWMKQKQFLLSLLKRRNSENEIPVVVIVLSFHQISPTLLTNHLQLFEMQAEGLLTKYKCMVIDHSIMEVNQLDQKLETALQWIIEESQVYPSLLTNPLSSFVEDIMALSFFKIFNEHCLHCQAMELASDPAKIVELYNNAIEAISAAVLESHHQSLEDVTAVWNDDSMLKHMSDLVLSLKLPSLPPVNEGDWDSSYSVCVDYVWSISAGKISVLINRINSLLQQSLLTSSLDSSLFPWATVLEVCIINKMGCMYSVPAVNHSGFNMPIHYHPGVIQHIRVVNPLKAHAKQLSMMRQKCQKSYNYRNSLKRRKFSREHQLRDSIENVNVQLASLEESVRKRKSSMKSSLDVTLYPIHDVLDNSSRLLLNVNEHKTRHIRNTELLSQSCNEDILLRTDASQVGRKERYSTTSICSSQNKNDTLTLEGSVVECLKAVEDNRTDMKAKEKYWQTTIDE